jgi:menaquinone-9 beta-reductase
VIRILGAGPAGACAALAARREGVEAILADRSSFPKHKVCGEFISPEIAPVLDELGVWPRFSTARPFSVRRMGLHFGSRSKWARLHEAAYGLSRYRFDSLLLGSTEVTRGLNSAPQVIATGRSAGVAPGARLFGFKAHFEGPVDDAVELFFQQRAYVGVNCVEDGKTNVCGLAPEDTLRAFGFEPEALIESCEPLRDRLRPLHRSMKWMFAGPLEYAQRWDRTDAYLAGDALSFVDPFTGSGMLCAAVTGALAGKHAARGVPAEQHHRVCREAIGRPFVFSSVLRRLAATEWAERLVGFVPARLLFRLTRPR